MNNNPQADNDNDIAKLSDDRPFADILENNMNRRDVLVGGLAAGGAGFLPSAASVLGAQPLPLQVPADAPRYPLS